MKKRQLLFLFLCIAMLPMTIGNAIGQECTPSSSQQEAWISSVRSLDFSQTPAELYQNTSGASTYSDFTGTCMPVNYASTSQQINITPNAGGLFIGVWVDVNNDGDFTDPGEERLNVQDNNNPGIATNLNGLNLTGGHLMRIIVSTQPITGPCDNILNGEVEDYQLCGGEECPWISQVRLFDNSFVNNSDDSPGNYSDYKDPCIPVFESAFNQINVQFSQADVFRALYIDLNGNGDFSDPGEMFVNGQGNGFGLGLSGQINSGLLTGGEMVRIIVSSNPIVDPNAIPECGEVEDYTLCGGKVCPWISQVRLFDNSYVNNSDDSVGNYSDYKDPCIPLFGSTFNQINVQASQGDVYRALYIDLNGNGDFSDPGEMFANGFDTNGGFGVGLSAQINNGTITGGEMVRVIVSSDPITDPNAIPECGEVEDYTLCGGEECPWIAQVRLFDNSYINNTDDSVGNYSDYKDPCIPLFDSTFNQINVQASQGDVYRALYIDLNGNGDFSDPGEMFANGFDSNGGFGVGLSAQINSGIITGNEMVRVIVSSDPITDPNAIPSCGEVEDYTICGKPNCEDLDVSISNIQCYNQGTSDPSDDHWTFDITVTDLGGNGTYWRAGDPVDEAGSYGTKTIWMGAIADYGDTVTFEVYDNETPDCVYTVTIDTPESCSDPCELEISYEIGECVGDNQYYVTLNVSGTNGLDWMAKQKLESNGNETVLFNGTGDATNVQLGPIDISEGDWTLWVKMVDYYDCLIDVFINAPEPCDDKCECEGGLQTISATQIQKCIYLVAAASVASCDGFEFSESYTIDYGDGSPIETTNSNGGYHQYPGDGSYTVTMTHTVTNLETGCSTTVSRTDTIEISCEGGDDPVKPIRPRLYVYPNPSKDIVNFEITTASKDVVTIQVYNIYGREVYSNQVNGSSGSILNSSWDARSLKSGIYVAIMTVGDTTIREKIIIE